MATASMPRRLQVRAMRAATSPRLAIKTFLNMAAKLARTSAARPPAQRIDACADAHKARARVRLDRAPTSPREPDHEPRAPPPRRAHVGASEAAASRALDRPLR